MRELNDKEVELVSGGIARAPLVATVPFLRGQLEQLITVDATRIEEVMRAEFTGSAIDRLATGS